MPPGSVIVGSQGDFMLNFLRMSAGFKQSNHMTCLLGKVLVYACYHSEVINSPLSLLKEPKSGHFII